MQEKDKTKGKNDLKVLVKTYVCKLLYFFRNLKLNSDQCSCEFAAINRDLDAFVEAVCRKQFVVTVSLNLFRLRAKL